MEQLSDIAVFTKVVDQGTFTAAARQLELSKSAVSKYVSRLEARLGTRLLNRTTRRLTLTEAGEILYRRAGGALADLDAAENEILELTGAPRGRLRVTMPTHFGELFLAPLLCDFMHDFPDITLELHLDNRLVDLVEERFDVGIRISALADSSLVARRLATVDLVTCAAPAYLQRRGTPAQPGELRDHDCMHYTLMRSPGEWQYRRPGERWFGARIGGRLWCDSDAMMKRLALDGLGILRFPRLFVEDEIRRGLLQPLFEDFEMPEHSLSAIFPTRENLAPKVRVFVDFLVSQFQVR